MNRAGFHALANRHTGSIAHPTQESQRKMPSCTPLQLMHAQWQAKLNKIKRGITLDQTGGYRLQLTN